MKPLQVFSSAFAEGGSIPPLHTCSGADVSPALEWNGVPEGTRSFALIMEDPDAPMGTWIHWLLFDIPGNLRTLAQGTKQVGVTGTNSFGRLGYGGPCPPPGRAHRYYFRLYALSVERLGVQQGAQRKELERAMKGHVLAEAACMGRFHR